MWTPDVLTDAYDAETDEGALLLRASHSLWDTSLSGDDGRPLFGVVRQETLQALDGWEAHRAACQARTASGRRFDALYDRVTTGGRGLSLLDLRDAPCWEDGQVTGRATRAGVRWRWLATPRAYVPAGTATPDSWQPIGTLPLNSGGTADLLELAPDAEFNDAVLELAS